MKIKASVLENFLDKINMNGTESIHDCVLDFAKDGLKVISITASKSTQVNGWLKTAAFTEYEAIGEVGMNEIETFVKILNSFKDIITIKVEGNLMTLSMTGKKVEIETVDTSFITVDKTELKLEFTDTFIFSADTLHTIIKNVTLNTDAIICFKTEAKLLKISNTGKYKFNFEYNIPSIVGGVDVKFGKPFIEAFNKVTGDVTIQMKSNYPVKILENNIAENYVISYICAPRVDNAE